MKIGKLFSWFRKKDHEKMELKRTAQVFGTLDTLQKKGLLSWDARQRRLFICEPLARVMLESEEKWTGFLDNVFQWQTYERQREAWEKFFTKEEAKAVREAQKKYCIVTKAETDRIRRRVRDEIENNGQIPTPKIEPYEVFIIGDATPPLRSTEDHKKAEAMGQILAVGQYDPDTKNVQMAMWAEVQARLSEK